MKDYESSLLKPEIRIVLCQFQEKHTAFAKKLPKTAHLSILFLIFAQACLCSAGRNEKGFDYEKMVFYFGSLPSARGIIGRLWRCEW